MVLCGLLSSLCACAHLTSGSVTVAGESRGRPNEGWLAHSTRLPETGVGYRTFRTEAEGGRMYGTRRLVGMIQHLAEVTGREGRSPLRVGDLSQPGGGHVTRHHSHRVGRDVDILFYVRNRHEDAVAMTPGFVRFDERGNSTAWPHLEYDVARNWTLVETLLREPDISVVRIFVASWIEQWLLDHARAQQRPAWLLERAERVMLQPGDAEAHDDHFHVRIGCTAQERALGCVDGGPAWPWAQKEWEKDVASPADDDTVLSMMEPIPAVEAPAASPRAHTSRRHASR